MSISISKPKRGRKPSPNAKRSKLTVRMTENELNAVSAAASKKGQYPSTFVREILLDAMQRRGFSIDVTPKDKAQLSILD